MQDTSWLDVYLSDIPHIVYQVDDLAFTMGAQHRTVMNKGNEAMAYLQFIIDYYDRLPASIVFLHGHRYAPKTQYVPSALSPGAVPGPALRFASKNVFLAFPMLCV